MSPIFWFYFVIYLFYTAMGVGLLVAGALQRHGTAPLITGIFITAIGVPLLLLFSFGLRPVVLTDEVLRIPKAFGTREIPLRRLSGVGLIYRQVPRMPGWALQVWDDNGVPVRIGRWTVVTWWNRRPDETRKRLRDQRDWTAPLPHEDPNYLATTRAAQVAGRIYDAIMDRQGPTGPLATQARQKAIAYDPNSSAPVLAWWSPDGTMGRALSLPRVERSRHLAPDDLPKGPPRSKRALVIGLGGIVASIIVGVVLINLDGAGNAKHPTALQHGLVGVGATLILAGPLISIIAGIWTWRHRPVLPADTAVARTLKPVSGGWGWEATNAHPAAAQDHPAVATVPAAAPEVQQARRRSFIWSLATTPFFIALAILTPLMLNRPGHLSSGQLCQAVMGSASPHPSAACNAWRHHQILHYAWPASILALGILVVFVLQIRSIRRLQQTSRSASYSSRI